MTRMIDTPFPIRDGVTAILTLPDDLTVAEAERMAAMLHAWATEPPKERQHGR